MGRLEAGEARAGSVTDVDHLAEFDQLSAWTNIRSFYLYLNILFDIQYIVE
jgi:hypothetical protein